ncbi:Outward-rectifier potassium channel TOK1 [Talaromyces islandicus]|uniref:Outward-rectifier potassium channel TOK1 n=1 Tax=Talaromyces islandicus TaxID=28573 RepID=A0A0U1LSL8_TALIS|nr:Outward-rectifier potassium channel TOK1 [Talaromyces islandicus]
MDMSSTMDSPSATTKPQRVLACCEPAAPVLHRRKRRFPERELLDRIHSYEDLLSQNRIKFEPLHKDPTVGESTQSPHRKESYDSEDMHPETIKTDHSSHLTPASYTQRIYGAKNFWHAMKKGFEDPDSDSEYSNDDLQENAVRKTWGQLFENDDHLLFGSHKTPATETSALHPEPVQIFRLWQIFLENVNPLLKVVHTPSVQGCIIEAMSNISGIKPALEALMFAIYCMSVLSISVEDCQNMFGSSKGDTLEKYQLGCRQALSKCGFLRCNDRDCLTALYLYLISVRSSTVPQSLSSMLGVAMRIAQRMGIHSEHALARCTPLEGEMRRRLWWSLVLFDSRVNELADFKTTVLTPTWDCKIPLNVSDSELLPNMKELPRVQRSSTDALFAVVRSELGDFLRHTTFYLGFTNPALRPLAKYANSDAIPADSDLDNLEQRIEDEYLRFCDPENPLHFMTIWMTRGWLAKYRVIEYHSRYSSTTPQAESQKHAAVSYALKMLECDAKIATSPLTKGFTWLMQLYFPFPAYILVVQYLKRQPICDQADYAWKIMSDNYDAHFSAPVGDKHIPLFKLFSNVILQAWGARETAITKCSEPLAIPKIVLAIKRILAQTEQSAPNPEPEQQHTDTDMGVDDFPIPMPMGFGNHNRQYSMGGQDDYIPTGPEMYSNMSGLNLLDFDPSQLDWPAVDWGMVGYNWGACKWRPCEVLWSRAQQGTMGADMEADDSAEAPNIVIGSGETPVNYDQTPLKRIWTGFWDAFNMRPPVDEEPQDWWIASTAIPLVAATTAPLANVMSIVALVTSWRNQVFPGLTDNQDRTLQVGIKDPHWCVALNATSLALGVLGNLFLLFNFTRRVRYIIALPASIILWFLATGVLAGITASMHIYVPPIPPDEVFSQGYWSGVIAAVLYFILSIILMINMMGYMLGHYPQHFALTDDQRTLILQTTSFMIWLAVGGAIFQRLIGISYPDALYFSDITVLTLGYGDITPQGSVGKGLVFPYAVIGIVILALVVSSISRFTREVTNDNLIKTHLQRKRARTVARSVTVEKGDGTASVPSRSMPTHLRRRGKRRILSVASIFKPNQQAALVIREGKDRFNAMRAIQSETLRFRRWTSLVFSLIAFAIVWCAGAAVFSALEGITYFDALYFAFCSLLTIGYGDITPQSNPGRPFFIVWSLIAIPTMTILISKMSDTVLEGVNDATNWIAEFTVLPKTGRYREFVNKVPVLHDILLRRTERKRVEQGFHVGVDDINNEEDVESRNGSDTSGRARTHPRTAIDRRSPDQLARDLTFAIRRVAQDVADAGIKRYNYEEWVEFTQLIRFTDPSHLRTRDSELDENEWGVIEWDWIGENSPMLAEQTEPEWVLDRLTESLIRYMSRNDVEADNERRNVVVDEN